MSSSAANRLSAFTLIVGRLLETSANHRLSCGHYAATIERIAATIERIGHDTQHNFVKTANLFDDIVILDSTKKNIRQVAKLSRRKIEVLEKDAHAWTLRLMAEIQRGKDPLS